MSPRALLFLLAVACAGRVAARPVRRTLNFNMFVLEPKEGGPERTILTTDGVSRFGPIIEYLVQRVQGLMSVRHGAGQSGAPEPADNEVDSALAARPPGVVVRPSATRPGTYDVEIDVLVDDGQPAPAAPVVI